MNSNWSTEIIAKVKHHKAEAKFIEIYDRPVEEYVKTYFDRENYYGIVSDLGLPAQPGPLKLRKKQGYSPFDDSQEYHEKFI
jgi:hypothetical protein